MIRSLVLFILTVLVLVGDLPAKAQHFTGVGVFTFKETVGDAKQLDQLVDRIARDGISYVIVKSHTVCHRGTKVHGKWRPSFTKRVVHRFKAKGIRVYSYFTPSLSTMKKVPCQVELARQTLEMGADGIVVDDVFLRGYGHKRVVTRELFAQLRKTVNRYKGRTLAFSTFPHINTKAHRYKPWDEAMRYSDYFIPQIYWQQFKLRYKKPADALAYAEKNWAWAVRKWPKAAKNCKFLPAGLSYRIIGGNKKLALEMHAFKRAVQKRGYTGLAYFRWETAPRGVFARLGWKTRLVAKAPKPTVKKPPKKVHKQKKKRPEPKRALVKQKPKQEKVLVVSGLPDHFRGLGYFTFRETVKEKAGLVELADSIAEAGVSFVVVKSHDKCTWGTRVMKRWQDSLTTTVVNAFHRRKMRVYAYFTVDLKDVRNVPCQLKLVKRALDLGVDGIVADGVFIRKNGRSVDAANALFAGLRFLVDQEKERVLAFSTFPHLRHKLNKDVPWNIATKFSDYFIPQIYWQMLGSIRRNPVVALNYAESNWRWAKDQWPEDTKNCTLIPAGMSFVQRGSGKDLVKQVNRFIAELQERGYPGAVLFRWASTPFDAVVHLKKNAAQNQLWATRIP